VATTHDHKDVEPRIALERAGGRVSHLADEIWGVIVHAQRHRTTGLASQFAYNAFIATVPMILTLLGAIRIVAGTHAGTRVVRTYNEEIPTAYQSALHSLLTSALNDQNRALAAVLLGAIAALYLAGNAIGGLIVGLDAARGVPDRPWILGKLVGIRIAAEWILLATAVNVTLLVGQSAVGWLARTAHWTTGTYNTLHGLVFFLGTLILLVMVWVIYRTGPNAPLRRGRAYLGGLVVAALSIVAFTQLFAAYVDRVGGFSVYGALFGVVIYLTLLWGIGAAVLLGAEVNEAIIRHRDGHLPPQRPQILGGRRQPSS